MNHITDEELEDLLWYTSGNNTVLSAMIFVPVSFKERTGAGSRRPAITPDFSYLKN